MSLWTWFGLKEGRASTGWPLTDDEDGQQGVLGMPRFDPAKCEPGCDACARVCDTHAIAFVPSEDGHAAPPPSTSGAASCASVARKRVRPVRSRRRKIGPLPCTSART